MSEIDRVECDVYDAQARNTLVLLRNEKVETTQAEEASSDVADKQTTSHVEDASMQWNLSDSNDVITVIYAYYLCFRGKQSAACLCACKHIIMEHY